MRQAPIGNFRMPRVHVPQSESPEPSGRLLALVDSWAVAGHSLISSRLVRSRWRNGFRIIVKPTADSQGKAQGDVAGKGVLCLAGGGGQQ
jgi:hypothetical protein